MQERLFKYVLPEKKPELVNRFVDRWSTLDLTLAEILRRINNCDKTLLDLSKFHTLEFSHLLQQCNIPPLKISEVFDFLMEDGLRVKKNLYDEYEPKKDPEAYDSYFK